ncbi:CMGC SRPK kinase [Fusarium subglutinans]|uniref:CMGC SRPK kinase n=1 Tax=Gibberella subglutinans TaxID=42677 RepID=A0A8H5LG10_GIBSU|nr:CMGC SRPK kinase [Fusarium subglutinans]KAF5590643.1 CMGC SRPK kinase [Fusarium subglutinans]
MNGTQSPDAQKATNANTNESNSNNSSLAAKKRKKDLKPIITMEGTNQPAGRRWSDVANDPDTTQIL